MWDPASYRALMEFRHICFREYGGLLEAFKYALDLDGSGTCRKTVLVPWLKKRIEVRTYRIISWDFPLKHIVNK